MRCRVGQRVRFWAKCPRTRARVSCVSVPERSSSRRFSCSRFRPLPRSLRDVIAAPDAGLLCNWFDMIDQSSEGRKTMKTILVGYDDSESSQRALLRAGEVAQAFGAEVHVTSVTPMLVGTPRSMGPYDPADPPSEHEKQLEHARALLGEQGITASTKSAHGDPADAILEVADEVDADLIVLGTHERSLLERALGMSVSGAVSRKAHRDLL